MPLRRFCVRTRPTTGFTDVWSLGIILFLLLATSFHDVQMMPALHTLRLVPTFGHPTCAPSHVRVQGWYRQAKIPEWVPDVLDYLCVPILLAATSCEGHFFFCHLTLIAVEMSPDQSLVVGAVVVAVVVRHLVVHSAWMRGCFGRPTRRRVRKTTGDLRAQLLD